VHTACGSCERCLGTYEYAVRSSCASICVPMMGMLSVVPVYAVWVSVSMLAVETLYSICYLLCLYACCL
jgi:hypothetical protein